MGDDLSQFFAKKAAKTKDKKKKVKVNLDEVGEVLEREAKRQEERDRENEGAEKAAQEEANVERRSEDSEWLEYKDSNREIVLEELGIRDMNLTEQVEEALEEEKATTNEAPKTWNTAEKKESSEEVIFPQIPPQPQKYVVRQKQLAALKKTGVVPNLDDHDMFPTFADAEKMEKINKDVERKKKNDGFTVVTSDRDSRGSGGGNTNAWDRRSAVSSAGGDRGAALAAVKQVTSSGAPNPLAPKQTPQVGKGKYIPPHLRRQVQS
ncbi:unnamed protein product [Enterobius vermicularis]|uniref:Protein CDV3 homolog n=1 Tax=Enterobius vermicularis TaxID=51028 RepID=A0A0N4V2H1_ENTVE|nr:unnamed protein product [Enterobius vermicularis]